MNIIYHIYRNFNLKSANDLQTLALDVIVLIFLKFYFIIESQNYFWRTRSGNGYRYILGSEFYVEKECLNAFKTL